MRIRGIVRITGKTVGVTALVGFAVAMALLLITQPKLLFPPEGFGKDLPPVQLLEGFYSYSTRKQVKTGVLARGLHW
jgi:hypothetical protein